MPSGFHPRSESQQQHSSINDRNKVTTRIQGTTTHPHPPCRRYRSIGPFARAEMVRQLGVCSEIVLRQRIVTCRCQLICQGTVSTVVLHLICRGEWQQHTRSHVPQTPSMASHVIASSATLLRPLILSKSTSDLQIQLAWHYFVLELTTCC